MSPTPPASRTVALLGSLALSACAHSPVSAPEASSMSATAAASTATPDARSLLQAALDLVVDTRRVADITPERLGAAMDARVQTFGPATHYGFGGPLTREWAYSVEVDQASMHGPRMSLSFVPVAAGTYPAATDICALDFDAVASRLKAAGFRHETTRGEHDRIVDEKFHRDGQTVTVLTQGEAAAPDAKVRHACVTSLILG